MGSDPYESWDRRLGLPAYVIWEALAEDVQRPDLPWHVTNVRVMLYDLPQGLV